MTMNLPRISTSLAGTFVTVNRVGHCSAVLLSYHQDIDTQPEPCWSFFFMERQTRETEWIHRRSSFGSFERKVFWFAGYDCRHRCDHEVKGNHGQHGDELLIATRIASYSLPVGLPYAEQVDFEFGLSLAVMTSVRDQRLVMDLSRPARGYELMTHHAFRTTEEQVREGSQPYEGCKIIQCGKCFSGYSATTAADLFWTPSEIDALGQELLGTAPERHVLHVQTDMWNRLEQFLIEKQTEARALCAALPLQCPACKGHGLVPKLPPTMG
jgi:hypothetical protein